VLIALRYQYAERIIHAHTLKNVIKKVVNVNENKFAMQIFKTCNNLSKVYLKKTKQMLHRTKH